MTAPVIASVSSSKTGNPSTDITVTFSADGPSTPNANNAPNVGDVYVAHVNSVAALGFNAVLGATAGWTVYKSEEGRVNVAYFVKVMDGTETGATFLASPSDTATGMTCKVARITGAHATPVNASNVGQSRGINVTTYDVLGVTTTVDDCLVLYGVGAQSGAVRTFTSPGALTEQWDFGTDPGDAAMQTTGSKTQAAAGATGTQQFSLSGTATTIGVCIAIAPALVTTRSTNRRLVLGVG
jgi:hypothetical protein